MSAVGVLRQCTFTKRHRKFVGRPRLSRPFDVRWSKGRHTANRGIRCTAPQSTRRRHFTRRSGGTVPEVPNSTRILEEESERGHRKCITETLSTRTFGTTRENALLRNRGHCAQMVASFVDGSMWSIRSVYFGSYPSGLPRSPLEHRLRSVLSGPSPESSRASTLVGDFRAFQGVFWSIDFGRYSSGLPWSPLEHRPRSVLLASSMESSRASTSVGTLRAFPGVLESVDFVRYT
ncbi:hypothetical protein MRX96_052636 [Rhipicephalus microplus]